MSQMKNKAQKKSREQVVERVDKRPTCDVVKGDFPCFIVQENPNAARPAPGGGEELMERQGPCTHFPSAATWPRPHSQEMV